MARLFPQAAHSGSRSLVLNCSRIGYLPSYHCHSHPPLPQSPTTERDCLGASAPGTTTARSCHASRRPAGSLWLAALGPATQSPNPDASARSDEQQLDVPLSQQLSRRRRAKAAPAPPADSDAAEGGPLPAPIPSTPRRGRPPKAASALTDNSSSTSQITTSTSSSLPFPDERATSSSGSSSSDSSTTGASWQLGRSRDVAADTAASDGAAPAPGPPQHPAVTFRNAAELRQLLQARAAAAAGDGGAPWTEEGQEASGATQAAQPNMDAGEGAGPPPGAAGTSHRPAAPGPTALPPRRFFAAVPPGRSRDSGTSQFADASGSSRGSSSSSSWGGRAGSSTPPLTAQARSSRVTHLPWKGAASRGSGDADSTDGAAGAAAEDGSWDHDKDYNKAKTYALRLLQRTPLAAGDLGRRLQERGHGRQAVAALLTWLADNGALNDALFARLYARSKWVGNLTAPAKIKKDLAAQGVAASHVAAALTFVFGPSHRVRLSGHSLSAEEQEVQDMFLEAARKQVERRGGGGGAGAGASGGDADDGDDEGLAGGGSDSEREAAAAAFKERDRRRRRLGMWLQYRGHDMDLIIKTFGVLRI